MATFNDNAIESANSKDESRFDAEAFTAALKRRSLPKGMDYEGSREQIDFILKTFEDVYLPMEFAYTLLARRRQAFAATIARRRLRTAVAKLYQTRQALTDAGNALTTLIEIGESTK